MNKIYIFKLIHAYPYQLIYSMFSLRLCVALPVVRTVCVTLPFGEDGVYCVTCGEVGEQLRVSLKVVYEIIHSTMLLSRRKKNILAR